MAASARQHASSVRVVGQWEDELWADATSGADVFYNVWRWVESGTGRYTRPDPFGVLRPGREALFDSNHLYNYAAGQPLFFIDPLGLKVVIQNPDTEAAYDGLKSCFPLFRSIADHFENDTWTDYGPARTWSIKDPIWSPPSCNQGGISGESRTIWVPPDASCEETARCLFHEFYERWLIDVGGYSASQLGAGPADRMARRFAKLIPKKCCECKP